MGKRLEEALKGRIVGFSHNNFRIGTVESVAPKVKSAEPAENVTVNAYLARWDRVGEDPENPSPDPAIVPPYPKINDSSTDWFPTSPYTVTVPGDTTLMEIFLAAGGVASSNVTNIQTITGTGTPTNPDWLEGFRFHGTLYAKTDDYIWKEDGNGNITGGIWFGWAPMYFIGTPLAYDSTYVGFHGTAYPDLRLNQFEAKDLPLNNFTISYENTYYEFDVRTESVKGERVHTLTRRVK
jgi:hypothetical protein